MYVFRAYSVGEHSSRFAPKCFGVRGLQPCIFMQVSQAVSICYEQ